MTNQPELFSDDRYRPPARASDPATSHQAAEQIRPKLGKLQQAMYSSFCMMPQTASEAARYCQVQLGGNFESYRKRTGELQKAGMIRPKRDSETGQVLTRPCGVTGSRATIYEVVG